MQDPEKPEPLQYSTGLTRTSPNLEAAGIWYPPHPVDANKIWSSRQPKRRPDSSWPHGQWQFDGHKFLSLSADFQKSPHHTLVLSSEFFYPHLLDFHRSLPRSRVHPLPTQSYRQCGIWTQPGRKTSFQNRTSFELPPALRFGVLGNLRRLFTAAPTIKFDPSPLRGITLRGREASSLTSFLSSGLMKPFPTTHVLIHVTRSKHSSFKRLLNHFPLGSLDPSLDRLLQRCEIGRQTHYSLTDFMFSHCSFA